MKTLQELSEMFRRLSPEDGGGEPVGEAPGRQPPEGGGGGEADAGADAGGNPPDKGDLSVALRQSREEVRTLKGRLRALEQSQAQQGTEIDFGKFHLTDEELAEGNAAAINAKLEQAMKEVAKASTSVARQTATQQAVEGILGEFEIFDDPEVGEFAAFKAQQAVAGLPKGASVAAVRKAVGEVARAASRFKADPAPPGQPDKIPPSQPGGGGVDAAHLKPQFERPKSDKEARAITAKIFGE